jgi:hypothetical protein
MKIGGRNKSNEALSVKIGGRNKPVKMGGRYKPVRNVRRLMSN